MRPIAIDLFAGAGGMSLGFEQAGFDIVAAVEVDPIHCAVHKFNFPECAVLPRSVVGLSAKEIRDAAGIGSREIDCVFGGPPCQGFSMIGQRALSDPRNSLVMEFVRLVAELDAKTFVFENVKGLTVGRHREFLDELVSEFERIGYRVERDWKVLNAADYGVPQSRERLILLGSRKGQALPKYPAPLTARNAGRMALASTPTCEDALSDLPDADLFPELIDGDTVRNAPFGRPSSYAAGLRCLTNDAWHYGYVRNWDPLTLTSSSRTNHTIISRNRFKKTAPGTVEPISRFYKLARSGVSNTLRAGTDGARGAFTSPRPIHYEFDRCVTVREMARLHGYPDWFRFHVTKWHGARQIGNSVPPPLARAIAGEVIDAVKAERTKPQCSLTLGDKLLLKMELTAASRYFSIQKPNSRRDRKSGARKRKQEEIEALQADTLVA